jgi:two-component system, cell cycle sensor histidine kinase and response regulator CckA
VRELARSVLTACGYSVLTKDPLPDAFVYDDKGSTIDLLLTDVVMPGINGRELADRLLAQRPETKVLFMSGYTNNAIVHHQGLLAADTFFIQKPFTPSALAAKVREVLNTPKGFTGSSFGK